MYLILKAANLQYIDSLCLYRLKRHQAAYKGYRMPFRAFSRDFLVGGGGKQRP